MILSHDANPGRIEFRKGHTEFSDQKRGSVTGDVAEWLKAAVC